MTVIATVAEAAPWLGITVPTVLFSGTDRTSVELQAAVNEAALAVADDFDWQVLRSQATITGSGTTTDWPLPSDYGRTLKKANLWPSWMPAAALLHVVDSDRWLEMDVQAFQSIASRWTIYGGQLHIKPAIPAAATVKYFYMSANIVSGAKTKFSADDDSFVLDERLLKLSLIWRWKAAKGRAYAEDMANYTMALEKRAGSDKGSTTIRVGQPRLPSDVTIAWPGVLGTP